MSPVFAHGQLRLYLLSVLDEGPRHGYEVIQDLEQRFNGLYSPSAGTVYPRLAKLEEEGLVERSDEGRKATYRITEAGRAEVQARAGDVQDLRADLEQSVRQLAEEVRARVQHQASDLRAELRDAAREARATAVPAGAPDRRGGVGPGRRSRPRARGRRLAVRRSAHLAPRPPDGGAEWSRSPASSPTPPGGSGRSSRPR